MEFITELIKLDKEIFLFLNNLNSAYFDEFMYTYSKVGVWIPFYASVLYILFKSEGKKAAWIILFLIAGVILCDQISVLIKDSVQRLRPSHDTELENFIHLVKNKKAGLYGFVSSHATNTIGFAVLTSLIIRKRIYVYAVFAWAIITSYSRIYLAMHFPLDILGGALTGTIIALMLYCILKFTYLKKYKTIEVKGEKIPVYTLLITIFAIAVFSVFA